jgi:hypothetical protein
MSGHPGGTGTSGPTMPEWDVALSYAGEDRKYVRAVAEALSDAGLRVFFDEFHEEQFWGVDLYSHLNDVYQRATCCVIFVSKHYVASEWANHERRAAQARALLAKRRYLLPARFDDAELEGLPHTVHYLDLRKYTAAAFADVVRRTVAELSQRNVGSSRAPNKPDPSPGIRRRYLELTTITVGVALLVLAGLQLIIGVPNVEAARQSSLAVARGDPILRDLVPALRRSYLTLLDLGASTTHHILLQPRDVDALRSQVRDLNRYIADHNASCTRLAAARRLAESALARLNATQPRLRNALGTLLEETPCNPLVEVTLDSPSHLNSQIMHVWIAERHAALLSSWRAHSTRAQLQLTRMRAGFQELEQLMTRESGGPMPTCEH